MTNSPEHKALARQAADEAMVLLKNNGVLPLDRSKIKTLAVIGPNAADIHLGGYSAVPMEGVSVLQGLRDLLGEGTKVLYAQGCVLTANHASGWLVNENPVLNDEAADSALMDEAVSTALKSDAVVLVLGENELLRREAWSEEHRGDRDTLELVGRQNELARAVLATGKPVAVLLINGGPLAVNYLQEHAPAIIECWYLGRGDGQRRGRRALRQGEPERKTHRHLPAGPSARSPTTTTTSRRACSSYVLARFLAALSLRLRAELLELRLQEPEGLAGDDSARTGPRR